MKTKDVAWHGICELRLLKKSIHPGLLKSFTTHQSRCSAPFKLMRGSNDVDGRFEIPILHTAGGLVGGDQLTLKVIADPGTSGLLTTAAAQKVYGSVGLSRLHPEGKWAKQNCHFQIEKDADLEWLPQEVVMFGESLFEQKMRVDLYPDSSFFGAEVVRLGRTSAGENLGAGCWRSRLEICRNQLSKTQWEFVDQLELGGKALSSDHGMANKPVFGSLVWIAPTWVSKESLENLVQSCLAERVELEGLMSCSALDHGLSARYLGASSQAARFWFFRIWVLTRKLRKLSSPLNLRVWPIQENPSSKLCAIRTD